MSNLNRPLVFPILNPLRAKDASNNVVSFNFLKNNGTGVELPGGPDVSQDIAYLHLADLEELDPSLAGFSMLEPAGTGNCFWLNFSSPGKDFTYFSSYMFDPFAGTGPLPDDGC